MASALQYSKLFINAEPGAILVGNNEFCRSWPNQDEITCWNSFYPRRLLQEIGNAIANLLRIQTRQQTFP